jgi:hypothetical protein
MFAGHSSHLPAVLAGQGEGIVFSVREDPKKPQEEGKKTQHHSSSRVLP